MLAQRSDDASQVLLQVKHRPPVQPVRPRRTSIAARGAAAMALRGSAFALLDRGEAVLRMVTDRVSADEDALCLALTCRPLRDAVFARFPAKDGKRLRTRLSAAVGTVSRFEWARRLWLAGSELDGQLFAVDGGAIPAALHGQQTLYHISGGSGTGAPRIGHLSQMLWGPKACLLAARAGSLAVLKIAAYQLPSTKSWASAAGAAAAAAGHFEVLQWVAEQHAAAVSFAFAKEDDPPIYPRDPQALTKDLEVCSAAAGGGQLRLLQWARRRGYGWGEQTCASAAASGHLDVLVWARKHGCPWDSSTGCGAAARGDMRVLKWLLENDYGEHFDEDACAAAAEHGQLQALRWLRANHCDWDESTCFHAAGGGHLHVLAYAVVNGCEWPRRTHSAAAAAARGGHLATLQYARANGCPW